MKNKKMILNNEHVCFAAQADNPALRLRGMLGRTFEKFEAMAITPCNQIHTQFMSFPIDVVYISRIGTVLKTEENVQPWRFCKSVKGARTTIEMPTGSIKKYKISVGDQIIFN